MNGERSPSMLTCVRQTVEGTCGPAEGAQLCDDLEGQDGGDWEGGATGRGHMCAHS